MIPRARIYPLTVIAFALILNEAAAQTSVPSHSATVVDSMPRAKQIQQTAISPDGKQVAYIVRGELTVLSLDNIATHSIEAEGKLALRDVCWSPDSKQLAFLADLPGDAPSAQLWTASADGATPTKRAELKGNVGALSYSPDGSKLAVLFVEGMPREAGPLQPMTPLAGVVGEKIYEQRLTTIDLATNAVTQVTPADVYLYEYFGLPTARAGGPPLHMAPATPTGTSRGSITSQ